MLVLTTAALMLCTVAFLNGGPIYYPDTSAYLVDADRLFHHHAPYAVRPVFYGLLVWPLYAASPANLLEGFGLALFLQALVVAHIIYVTLRAVGAGLAPRGFLLLTAALVLFTPLSFHVSHLLPDIYIAVLVLALFLLGFCHDALRRGEVIYLFLLAAATASFHLTALPIGATIAVLAVLPAVRGTRWCRPALVVAPLALATVMMLAFSVTVFQRLTFTPHSPPHLLARVLADGPGTEYLRATCPNSGYALCRYLDQLPMSEDEFLWRLMPSVPATDGDKIKSEQGRVIEGTLTMFPLQVVRHAIDQTMRQLVTFKAETQLPPAEWTEFLASGLPWSKAFANTWQARGALEGSKLDGINTVQAGVILISLLIALVSLPRLVADGLTKPAALIVTTLAVLLANAAVCGALGGVFARYQGRMIWLLPLAAVAASICILRQPRPAEMSLASAR